MAKGLFDLLLALPAAEDADWLAERNERLAKSATRVRREYKRRVAKRKRIERRGAEQAARALAKVGSPENLERGAELVKAMRAGEWYTAEDLARLTRTWPAWVRAAVKGARALGWVRGPPTGRRGRPSGLVGLSDLAGC